MVDKYFIFKYQLDLYKLLQLQFVVFINDIYFMLCFFFSFFFFYLFGRFCLDKLWVDPVGRGDHLWDRLDFFVVLPGKPKQYVLLTVLRLQELPESYLSGCESQRTVSS